MYVCRSCCQWGMGVGDQLLLMHVVVVTVVPLMLLLVAFNRCTLAARSLTGTFTVDCQAGRHAYQPPIRTMHVCVGLFACLSLCECVFVCVCVVNYGSLVCVAQFDLRIPFCFPSLRECVYLLHLCICRNINVEV